MNERMHKERAKYVVSKFKFTVLDQRSVRDQLSCGLEGKADYPVICVCECVCVCGCDDLTFQRPTHTMMFYVRDI